VAAASDLAVLEIPLRDLYRKHYKRSLRFVLGSSGRLASQIRNGAPYDVFLSANTIFVAELSASGHLLPDSVRPYAYGRLALWSKSGQINAIEQLAEARYSHVAIANPLHAPYGVAAREALRRAGLWQALKNRLVLGENVRQALQFAESGNAEACIVAWSLVKERGGVLLPERFHEPIRQAGGVISSSTYKKQGRQFLEMLSWPAGITLLENAGFQPVRQDVE
jgi:molybdate transport system substrate-binding protein